MGGDDDGFTVDKGIHKHRLPAFISEPANVAIFITMS